MRRRKRSLYEAFSAAHPGARPSGNGAIASRPRGAAPTGPGGGGSRLSLHALEAPRPKGPFAVSSRGRMVVWVGGTVLAVSAVFVLAQMAGRASRPGDLALSAQHGGGEPASVDDAAGRVDPPAADPSRDVPRGGDPSGGLESGSASALDGVAGMRYALCVGAWPGGETGERQARGLIAELDREGFPQVQGLVLQPSGEIRVFVGQAREATDPALENLRERAIRFLRDTVLSDPATVRIEALPTVVR